MLLQLRINYTPWTQETSRALSERGICLTRKRALRVATTQLTIAFQSQQ